MAAAAGKRLVCDGLWVPVACTGLAHGLVLLHVQQREMTRMEVVDVSADASRWDAPSSAAVKALGRLRVQSSGHGQVRTSGRLPDGGVDFGLSRQQIWRFYLCVVLLVM